jgi:sulfur-oxidizing protein SoxY
MQRRTLFRTAVTLLLLRPLAALAELRHGAFAATSLPAAMQALFGARAPEPSGAVLLDVEPRIENGAFVPVQVTVDVPGVQTIDLFGELNPNPLLARFHLSPRCRPFVATRVKVAAPSHLVVVAESGERLLETRKFVEVAEGGCG